MKDLKTYLIKESHINYDDVYDALYSYFAYRDEFALDPHWQKKGTGAECLEEMGCIGDILDFHDGWDDIADEVGVDVEELQDFVYDNEDKLYDQLMKEL